MDTVAAMGTTHSGRHMVSHLDQGTGVASGASRLIENLWAQAIWQAATTDGDGDWYMSCFVQLSLRYTLTCLLFGEDAPYDRWHHVGLTSLIVGSALAVALVFPTAAEKIYAVTGTAPLVVSRFPFVS